MKNTYRAAIVGLGRMGHLFEEDPLMRKPCSHAGAYSYLYANTFYELSY